MKKKKLLIMSFAGLLLSSCAETGIQGDEDILYSGPLPLVIQAEIAGSGSTRAEINPTGTDDEWSYTDFEPGDAMGFFASGGKFTGDNYGQAPFDNQRLIYVGGTGEDNFRDPDGVEFSPSHMNGNEIYMYFPYSNDITSGDGVELRTNERPDGVEVDTVRCIDFLSTRHLDILSEGTSTSAALYGEFQHTFAELIIMRGEGFDNPPDMAGVNKWQIKAVLNKPVTGIRAVVNDENGWSCEPQLVYDNSMESSKAQEWYAWQGANFYRTQEDKEGQIAWYVIVPTIGSDANIGGKRPGERTVVEYIELYDNDGNLQRVSSLLLSNANSKYVDGGWRYPMEITLTELVPTANPCQIVPWNGDIDLTDERKRGINNETEFEGWVKAYNAYITQDNEETSNALFQYGDLYLSPEGDKYWHFYVLSDLNLSSYSSAAPIVPLLKDIIDGQSTVFTNGRFQRYSITGLSTTLFGKMEGKNAQVLNFRFVSPNVNCGSTNTDARGIIVNEMSGNALVENCQISGGTLYNPAGPGGMVAGEISESTIKDCVLSGFLISSRTVDDIVGVNNGGYTSQGNNANNVTNQDIDD